MSEFKGTPGPWYVGDLGEDGPKPRYWIITDERTWSDRVCSVPEYDKMKSEANARLIAAAPDLLEAASMALSVMEVEYTTNNRTDLAQFMEPLRAAIAKALGEEK